MWWNTSTELLLWRELNAIIRPSNVQGAGRGGVQMVPLPEVFPTQKLNLFSNQNDTFSTCSPIMKLSIYAQLIMQITIWIRKL